MPEDTVCVNCVVGFPHPTTQLCGTSTEENVVASIKEAVKLGRPQMSGADMDDPESAGRKRAAAILPDSMIKGMICEWALLKEAGGGINPIVGCHGNPATDRHHGCDKNTLNNERGINLHAICAYCHNRWHAANDKTYEGTRPKDETPWLPVGEYKTHDPAGPKMSIKEALVVELTRI